MFTHDIVDICFSSVYVNSNAFVVHTFLDATLIPIATTFRIGAGLLVECFHFICIAELVRSAADSQTERYTG